MGNYGDDGDPVWGGVLMVIVIGLAATVLLFAYYGLPEQKTQDARCPVGHVLVRIYGEAYCLRKASNG